MNNELDKYLQHVAHELRGLEPHQREAELREMRSHLEAIVARLMDGGANESEAIEAAIGQFGAAQEVGRELKDAGQKQDGLLRIAGAVAASLACYQVLLNVHLSVFSFNWLQSLSWPIHYIVSFYIPFLSGIAAGCIARRWGGLATLGTTIVLMAGMGMGTWSRASLPITALILLTQLLGAFFGSRYVITLSLRRRSDVQRA